MNTEGVSGMMTRENLSGNRPILGSVLLLAVAMAGGFVVGADPSLTGEIIARVMALPDETDVRAPVDYGAGPGVPPQADSTTVSAAAQSTTLPASGTAVPSGTAAAATGGLFGAPITWPVIPIHSILLPDGRIMSYGTNAQGQQGAELIYDVWNPSEGTGTSAHSVL